MLRILLALALMTATVAAAQTPPPAQSAILTLDQEALFSRSQFGKALRDKLAAEFARVEAETRAIDAAVEAEERDLTARRATLPDEEFRILAEAFDAKVQDLRAQREAAAAALRDNDAAARQEFIAAVTQIIGDYMLERGAVAIVDKKSIVVSLSAIDITAEVVARIDAKLGDGRPADDAAAAGSAGQP